MRRKRQTGACSDHRRRQRVTARRHCLSRRTESQPFDKRPSYAEPFTRAGLDDHRLIRIDNAAKVASKSTRLPRLRG